MKGVDGYEVFLTDEIKIKDEDVPQVFGIFRYCWLLFLGILVYLCENFLSSSSNVIKSSPHKGNSSQSGGIKN